MSSIKILRKHWKSFGYLPIDFAPFNHAAAVIIILFTSFPVPLFLYEPVRAATGTGTWPDCNRKRLKATHINIAVVFKNGENAAFSAGKLVRKKWRSEHDGINMEQDEQKRAITITFRKISSALLKRKRFMDDLAAWSENKRNFRWIN